MNEWKRPDPLLRFAVLLMLFLPIGAMAMDRASSFPRISFVAGDAVESSSVFNGAMPEGIEISLPRARTGLLTSVSLIYGGGDPVNPIGEGWSMPFPSIRRDLKDGLDYAAHRYVFFDGGTSYRLSAADSDDTRFIETLGGPSRRIVRRGNGANMSFEVTEPSGIRYVFGREAAARVADPGDATHVYEWLLSAIIDSNRNEVLFTWGSVYQTHVLQQIEYERHPDQINAPIRVRFVYAQRTGSIPRVWTPGFALYGAAQLETIVVEGRQGVALPAVWRPVRTLRLTTVAGQSLPWLVRLEDVPLGLSARLLQSFDYSGGDAAFAESQQRFELRVPASTPPVGLFAGDFLARGRSTVAFGEGAGLRESGGELLPLPIAPSGRLARVATGAVDELCVVTDSGPVCRSDRFRTVVSIPWTKPNWSKESNRQSLRIADVNGDGELDFCAAQDAGSSGGPTYECWARSLGSWLLFGTIPLSGAELANLGRTLTTIDVDADRRADLCWADGTTLRCHRTLANGISRSKPFDALALSGLATLEGEPLFGFVSLQTDAYPDVCAIQNGALTCHSGNGRGFNDESPVTMAGAAWADPTTFASLTFLDLNGDQLTDVCHLGAPDRFQCRLRSEAAFGSPFEGPGWPTATLPGDSTAFGPRNVSFVQRPPKTISSDDGEVLNPAFVQQLDLAFSTRVIDSNADGREELCVRANPEVMDCWAPVGDGPFRMTSRTDSLGLRKDYSYILASQTESSNIERLHQPLIRRVDTTHNTNSRTVREYWYEGGMIDQRSGEFRGFGRVTVRENAGSAEESLTQFEFHQGVGVEQAPAIPTLVGRLRRVVSTRGGYRELTLSYQSRAIPDFSNAIAIAPFESRADFCDGPACSPPDAPPTTRRLPASERPGFRDLPPWADPPQDWRDVRASIQGEGSAFLATVNTVSAPSDIAKVFELALQRATRGAVAAGQASSAPPSLPTSPCSYDTVELIPGWNQRAQAACLARWRKRLQSVIVRDENLDDFGNVRTETHEFSDAPGYTVLRQFVSNPTPWIVDRVIWERVFFTGSSTVASERIFGYDEQPAIQQALDCASLDLQSTALPPLFASSASLSYGNLTTIAELVSSGSNGKVWKLERSVFDALGNSLCLRTPTGEVIQSSMDALRTRVVETLRRGGLKEKFEFAGLGSATASVAFGALTARVDANGQRWTTDYDAFARLARMTTPDGGTIQYTYGDASLAQEAFVSSVRSDGEAHRATLDGLGRVVRETALGPDDKVRVRETRYGALGQAAETSEVFIEGTKPKRWAAKQVDNAGRTVRSQALDSNPSITCRSGNIQIRVESAVRVSAMRFNAAGKMTELRRYTTVLRPADTGYAAARKIVDGRKKKFTPALPWEEEESDPAREGFSIGGTTSGWWDVPCGDSLLAETITAQVYRFAYDPLGRLARLVGPSGEEQTFTYTQHGEVASFTDTEVGSQYFSYDTTGLAESSTTVDSQKLRMTHDLLGRLTSVAVEGDSGPSRLFEYDGGCAGCLGRLSKMSFGGWTEDYAYDAAGRRASTRVRYDGSDRTVARTWTPFGLPARVTYPDASVAAYASARGSLTSIAYNSETVWRADAFDAHGRLEIENRGPIGQVRSRFHGDGDPECRDARSLPCAWKATLSAGTLLGELTYGFDDAGNVASRTDGVMGGGGRSTFRSDPLRRLLSVQNGGNNEEFSYSDSDALIRATRGGARTYTGSFTRPLTVGQDAIVYNTRNDVSTVRKVDGSEMRFRYDAFGHPVGIARADAAGDLIGVETQLVVNALGKIVAVRRNGETWMRIDDYSTCNASTCENAILLNGLTIASARATGPGASRTDRFYLHDFNGSVVIASGRDGASPVRPQYSAFGVELAGAVSDWVPRRGFARNWLLPDLGLQFVGSRLYDPERALFLQADANSVDAADPLSMNRYAYAGNNPIYFADPSGASKDRLVVGIALVTSSVAIGVAVATIGTVTAAAALPVGLTLGFNIAIATISGTDLVTGGGVVPEAIYATMGELGRYMPLDVFAATQTAVEAYELVTGADAEDAHKTIDVVKLLAGTNSSDLSKQFNSTLKIIAKTREIPESKKTTTNEPRENRREPREKKSGGSITITAGGDDSGFQEDTVTYPRGEDDDADQ